MTQRVSNRLQTRSLWFDNDHQYGKAIRRNALRGIFVRNVRIPDSSFPDKEGKFGIASKIFKKTLKTVSYIERDYRVSHKFFSHLTRVAKPHRIFLCLKNLSNTIPKLD